VRELAIVFVAERSRRHRQPDERGVFSIAPRADSATTQAIAARPADCA
jgi:hypothetical protein